MRRLNKTINEILDNNVLKVKQYNDNTFKILQFKHAIRQAGYEKNEEEDLYKVNLPPIEHDNPLSRLEILRQSMSRTKRTISDYALCNPFDYFVTLTFDQKKYNSKDLNLIKKQVGQWLNNYIKRTNPNLKYLLIPELHKDKEHFHLHGLISGIEDIKEFRLSKQGVMRYNWPAWHDKFGFTSLEKIRDKEAVSRYITKYITKDLVNEFGKQRYLVSKGLKKPETIYEVTDYTTPIKCDFENDYVRIKNYDSYEELLKDLKIIMDNVKNMEVIE